MDKLKKLTYELSDEIKKSLDKINYDSLKVQLKNLTEQSQQNDFWDNSQHAQIVMQELSDLQRKVEPWDTILSDSEYLKELIELNDNK